MFSLKQQPALTEFEKSTLEERLSYSEKLKYKYPNYIPIILKKKVNDKILQDIDKYKYLIPKNLDMSNLCYIIRKKSKCTEIQAIFIFVQQKSKGHVESYLVPIHKNISEIYEEYKSEDNFLYMIYSTENTFG